MELDSWQAVAHGADSVLFFQWRQSRGGAEKWHAAMVPHGGRDSRVFRDVTALGSALAAHPEPLGARPVRADAAIVLDWDNWWALEIDARPSRDVQVLDSALAHHKPLYDASVACDIVPLGADLSAYRLVLVPNLYMVTDEQASELTAYVEGGGTLVMSFFSGIVNEHDQVHLGGYPTVFRKLLGLKVDAFDPLPAGGTVELSYTSGSTGSIWSEYVELEGAEALAAFDSGPVAGSPAVTVNRYGKGTAYYLATRPDAATMRTLMDTVRANAGVAPVLADLPEGVQVRARTAADGTVRYVALNWTDEAVTVRGRELPAYGVAVL